MAIGDDAVAAGMPLVNGATAPSNQIDDEINRTRDFVAVHVKSERDRAVIAEGKKVDKPTDGAGMARIEPGSSHPIGFYTLSDSTLYFRPAPSTGVYDRRVAMYSEIPPAPTPVDISGKRDRSDGDFTGVQIMVPSSTAATSGYTVAYINGDGRLSRGASARRYKKYISDVDPGILGDIFPQLVRYQMRSGDGDWKLGYIADDLAGTDAERFMVVIDGEVESIDFIQMLIAQVARLHQRVTALEGGDL